MAIRNQVSSVQSGEGAFAITPGSGLLNALTRGIYVGPSGTAVDLSVEMADGSEVTFTGIAQGVVHPLQVRRVFSSGTTATGIIGIV